MRGIEVLLLLGFVGLVGIGLYSGREWFSHAGGTIVSSATPNASAPASKGAEKSAAKADRSHAKRSTPSGTQIAAVTAGDFPIATTEVQVPAPTFPTRKDLPIGTAGSRIREQYGEPTARVSEVRAGRMLEHYFYFNRDRTQVTVATLDHGSVVSVLSTLQ